MESKNPVFSRQAKGPQQGWGVPTPTLISFRECTTRRHTRRPHSGR